MKALFAVVVYGALFWTLFFTNKRLDRQPDHVYYVIRSTDHQTPAR